MLAASTPSGGPFVAFNPALTPMPAPGLQVVTPLSTMGVAPKIVNSEVRQHKGEAVAVALTEEQLELFRSQYPMDDSAFDYLRIAPPQVQQKVISTFRAPDTPQADYSRIITAHVTFCMNKHREAGQGQRCGETAVSVEEASAAIMGHSPQETVFIPEENLELFRNSYPMDQRAFDYLKSSPPEVQERVITTFKVDREQTDYSRAITAHVRFCVKRHREVTATGCALPGGADGAATMARLADFKQRFPMDERALSYLLQSSVEVKHRVLSEFRPAPGMDGDYSRSVTAFVRRCRDDEKLRQSRGPVAVAAQPTLSVPGLASLLGLCLSAAQQAQAQAALTSALQSAGVSESLVKRLRTESGLGAQPGLGAPPAVAVAPAVSRVSPMAALARSLPGGIVVRGPKPASLRPLDRYPR